jgi:flagellar protein FliS
MKATRAYAKTTQETATREQLMIMLFEAALKHMRQSAMYLETGKPLDALPLLTKASDIVTELAATLDVKRAPELGQMLGELYTFVAERLAHAAVFRDAKAARDAERAFAPIVEGFQQAVAQVQGQAAAP